MAMAKQQSLWENNPTQSFVQSEDIEIAGTMILVSRTFTINESEIREFKTQIEFEDFIKNQLAKDLANHLIKNKLVSFTKQENPMDYSRTYRARVCLVPSEKIQLLRKPALNY